MPSANLRPARMSSLASVVTPRAWRVWRTPTCTPVSTTYELSQPARRSRKKRAYSRICMRPSSSASVKSRAKSVFSSRPSAPTTRVQLQSSSFGRVVGNSQIFERGRV